MKAHTLASASLLSAVVVSAAHAPSAFSRRHHRVVKRLPNFLSTTQPGVIGQGTATAAEGCTLWMLPSAGDSCLSIITYSPGLSLSDFLDLNPSLDASCSSLEIGTGYCIDTDDEHTDASSSNSTSSGQRQLVDQTKKGTSCGSSKKKIARPAQVTATDSIIPASSTSSAGSTKATPISSGSNTKGLLEAVSPQCGKSDPSRQTSKQGGPNGLFNWLTCGISKSDPTSGWSPPNVTMDQIVYQELDESGVYAPCKPYFPLFKAAEKKHGVPAIFFAAFAMQESNCNPNASGDDGGAFGLMQITQDKCGSAPSGNCADPAYNVETAAQYFVDTLAANGNNPFRAVGQYNGWTVGLSYQSATANQAPGSCCECQQNLDYMHQYFNAWIQNLNGYDYTVFNNLAMC